MLFSIIIPLYNRPEEINELIASLIVQTYKEYEIIIVEDGSKISSENIIKNYQNSNSNIFYYSKQNEGPGPTRNYGSEKAKGDYFIFLDSDCIVPQDYLSIVNTFLINNKVDCFGGPDRAMDSFTPIQKAINYSMTALLTTGGIRGSKKSADKYYPRSFNMGIRARVFNELEGFAPMRFGEDLDLSMRIIENGYSTKLIHEAWVYHKRRTNFRKFYKQIFNSGIARITLSLKHRGTFKIVHTAPTVIMLGTILSIALSLFGFPYFLYLVIIYFGTILIDSTIQNKNVRVGFLSIVSALVQHSAYGAGFILAFFKRIILKKSEFEAFKKNFYK